MGRNNFYFNFALWSVIDSQVAIPKVNGNRSAILVMVKDLFQRKSRRKYWGSSIPPKPFTHMSINQLLLFYTYGFLPFSFSLPFLYTNGNFPLFRTYNSHQTTLEGLNISRRWSPNRLTYTYMQS